MKRRNLQRLDRDDPESDDATTSRQSKGVRQPFLFSEIKSETNELNKRFYIPDAYYKSISERI
jgi:hypothetical protein